MSTERTGPAWPMAVAAVCLVVAGLYPLDNPDTFGHLAAGRQIFELGYVPSHDSFSFFHPEPAPWVNYEWLSAVLFYGAYLLGGFGALAWLKSIVLALLGVVLVRRAYEREGVMGAVLAAMLLVLATAGARYRFSVRPHMFGLLLGAVYLVGLPRLAQAREHAQAARSPWVTVTVLAVLHVTWVNLHGSHLLGLLLTGLFAATSAKQPHARKPLFALLGLQAAASCISPYGPSIVLDAVAHIADPAYRELVEEWQAWTPDKPAWLMGAVVLQCAGMLVFVRHLQPGPLRNASLSIFAVLALMALRSLRFIPEFLLLSSPLLAEAMAPAVRKLQPRAQRVVLGAGFSLALGLPPGAAFGAHAEHRNSPAAVGGFLETRVKGARVFAAMEDSWYLMFAAPSAKFLLDGRSPFYGPAHLRAMSAAWSSPAALREVLDRYAVDAVVVQHALAAQRQAVRALESMPDFQLVAIEDHHALFLRSLPERERMLQAFALHSLAARYDAAFVLQDSASEVALRAELRMLPDHPNARGYQAFVSGLLALRPLARRQGQDGFAAPRTPEQRARAVTALSELRAANDALDDLPVVLVHHALAAVLACRLDEASSVLARVDEDTESRETLLTRQELLLREGRLDQVREFLTQARALPDFADDGWIAAIGDALSAPPMCR